MEIHKRDRKVVAAASFGIFQRLVQVGCTLLLIPIVLRTLGPADFGKWGAAASLAWLSGLVDIGIGSAMVTLVAQSIARDRVQEARTQIAGALGFGSFLGAAMLCLALIAWLFGASQGNSGAYLIALVGLAVNVPLNSANSVWMALQKGYVSSFWELMQTVLTTAALIAATAFTTDVRIYIGLVYFGLVVTNLGSLVHLFWSHTELRPNRIRLVPMAMTAVAASGLMYFVLNITGGLSFMLDNILALQLLGPEASARMTIAMRICMTAIGMLAVMSQPLWPAFTEAAHKADRTWIRRRLVRSTVMLVAISAAGSFVLLVYGEGLLRLWLHTTLGIGRGLLWAISAWVLAQALIRVPYLLLNGLFLVRFQIVMFWTATIVALGLKFALSHVLGVSGILWATTAAVLFIVAPTSLWRIYRWADAAAKSDSLRAVQDDRISSLDRDAFGS